jgi:UDP-N-acetylglucosamine 2-epimerase
MTKFDTIVVYSRKSYQKDNYIFVNQENFQISPISLDLTEQALKFLEQIQNASISGKSVVELLQYRDFSFWWILHPSLFPIIKLKTNFIKKFDEFLDQTKPSIVKIKNDYETFDIISQLCKNKNIKLEYSKKKLFRFKLVKKIIFQGQKYRYKRIFSNKIHQRKNIFANKTNPIISKKFVFVTPTIYRRDILNLKTGKSEKGEYISQTIMDFISEKNELFGIDLDYTFKGDHKILSERLKSDMQWAPIDVFIKNSAKELKHKEFLKNYKNILFSQQFKKLFEFNGISLWDQIQPTLFMMLYAPYFPYYLDFIDSISTLLSKEKPQAIFLTYETGPMALAFILAAQKNNIKTIGLAHSTIPKGYSMYSYNPIRTVDTPLGFPFPDHLLVFGDSSKNSLVELGYPEKKIISFGNAAFFNLENYITILNNNNLHQKYNIQKHQKVILFTTAYLQEYYETFGKYYYDTQILSHLIQNFSNNDDFFIIIKPHPSENSDLYEKMILENNLSNFKVIQDNLFELIHISDVVISVYSNSMTDALCFKKPVIRVTFDSVEHIIPYDEYNVILSCDLANLTKSIKNILSNDDVKNNLSKNRNNFLRDLYNIPEQNSKSILDEILKS